MTTLPHKLYLDTYVWRLLHRYFFIYLLINYIRLYLMLSWYLYIIQCLYLIYIYNNIILYNVDITWYNYNLLYNDEMVYFLGYVKLDIAMLPIGNIAID